MQPSPQQVKWQDWEFGVIVHFGTNTFLDREWGDGTASPSVFNPDHVDPAQWVAAAKSAGARYMILVAKHHDGFALWPTGQTNYSVKASPWMHGNGDLVKMTSDAARAGGIGFGIYLSPWDRHEPRYKDPAAYDRYYEDELVELASNYGSLTEWWLDGAGSEGHVYDFKRYVEQLRTYQANTMVFADVELFEYGDIRWVGNEQGKIQGEDWNVMDRHSELRWRPVEVDTPLHWNHWFWSSQPDYAASLKTVAQLMDAWENSVGKGGQLMLGIAPNRHGLMAKADVARLVEFGKALRARYGKQVNLVVNHAPTDANTAAALDENEQTFWSASPGADHATLEVDFDHLVTLNHSMAMERIDAGQHIRDYAVQVWKDGQWQTVAQAQAMGHMKIDTFASVTTDKVRLNIFNSVGTPQIREFKLFDVAK